MKLDNLLQYTTHYACGLRHDKTHTTGNTPDNPERLQAMHHTHRGLQNPVVLQAQSMTLAQDGELKQSMLGQGSTGKQRFAAHDIRY
jgi:hypothetical protein